MRIAELVEQAFLAGYRHGLSSYSWWRDGQQVVGSAGAVRLADATRAAPEDCKEVYGSWLQTMQVRHDGEEKPIVVETTDESGSADQPG